MQMPYPSWFTYELVDRTMREIKAFEHEVSITLPWRRYNPDVIPRVVAESPSVVSVGQAERFGAELAVRRVSYDALPSQLMAAEMVGELTEVWVQLTMEMSSRVDPRQE
jgi:hypothetical protein